MFVKINIEMIWTGVNFTFCIMCVMSNSLCCYCYLYLQMVKLLSVLERRKEKEQHKRDKQQEKIRVQEQLRRERELRAQQIIEVRFVGIAWVGKVS